MIIYKCDVCKKEVKASDIIYMKFSNNKMSLLNFNKELCTDCFTEIVNKIENKETTDERN